MDKKKIYHFIRICIRKNFFSLLYGFRNIETLLTTNGEGLNRMYKKMTISLKKKKKKKKKKIINPNDHYV